ncbi:MAG: ATPase, partial [Methyloprofundus sp.]|nr:ATPase [Methyloprofundus sp.]
NYSDADTIPPDEFASWVFPELFKSRLPRYQAIADKYGYTLDACDVAKVTNENDFIQLVAAAIQKTP